jgi:hypothetical protein
MLLRIRRRMTFANVCSFLALTIALGTGTAYAANTVFSTDIVNGEVKAVDIHPEAVVAGKIHLGAVNGDKVADGSLTAADLGTDSVGSDEIAANAVQATEIADDSIDTGEIVDNSLFSSDLAANAVGNSELAPSAVTGAKVSNNTITTADIQGADVTGHVSLSGIPNGRCNQVSFGVSGAQVGQVALVATGAAIQDGIVMYANRVSSPGHVEVNACNFSGGAMTAISNFPVRVITFG